MEVALISWLLLQGVHRLLDLIHEVMYYLRTKEGIDVRYLNKNGLLVCEGRM